ncbi:MAG: NHL repeat-containing protein [Desulfobulbaceae bacterium]|nr:NHL repeat-containing protein [Desulfobulbaceae bacterium]
MRNRTVHYSLFSTMFLLLFCWPGHSSFAQSNYELCSDIDHINVNAPMAVTVDSAENIYVAEAAGNSIHIYDINGSSLKNLKGLSNPISVAVAPEGDIYVGNSIKGKSNVAIYDNNLDFLFKLGSGDGEFGQPAAIAVSPTGEIYVVDRKQDVVKVYYPDGSFNFSFGSSGSAEGQFNSPSSLAIQAESVLVTDLPIITGEDGTRHEGARLQIFSLAGDLVDSYDKYGQGDGFLTKPLGIAIDRNGNILVADSYQNVMQAFDSSGIYQNTVYNTVKPMRTPLDITYGPASHRLYVASLNSDRVDFYCLPTDSFSVSGSVNSEGGTLAALGVTIEAESNYSFQLERNDSIALTISADNSQGYHLENVLIDGRDALSDPQLIIVDENEQQQPVRAEYSFTDIFYDHTIEVGFALNSYHITAEAVSSIENCGTISPAESVELNHGDSQTFTIDFDPDQCSFLDLIVDGISLAPQESWSFADVVTDHTIMAVFDDPLVDISDLCAEADDAVDADSDGVPDACDAFPTDPTETLDTDNDGIGNNSDSDDDNDGIPDVDDAFPLNATPIPIGLTIPPTDDDNSGIKRKDEGDKHSNRDKDNDMPRGDIDYLFQIVIKAAPDNSPLRAKLVLNGHGQDMILEAGNLVDGALYTLTLKLGPAAAHNFHYVAIDELEHIVYRYPDSDELPGPVVELLNGPNMVGLAKDMTDSSLDLVELFGSNSIYRWVSSGLTTNANNGSYEAVDNPAALTPGTSYFVVSAPNATLPDLSTYPETTAPTVTIDLNPGWNMISNLYGSHLKLSGTQVQRGNDPAITWAEACTNKWLTNSIYTYLGSDWGSSYTFESAGGVPEATLTPWTGYWIYLNRNDASYKMIFTRP